MKKCLRAVWKQAHWLLLAAAALATVYMDVYMAQHILDGDASQKLYHGWVIAQQNDPFTREMYYTTELCLLDVSAVFALFFHFISDWTTVRILGTVTMQVMYAASFLFACKQAGVSLRSAVMAAAFLLLPMSIPYARCVLYHLYYILYFTNAFLLLGLTIRALRSKGRPVVTLCLLGALWAFVGLNGIRHMMILGLPMLAFAAVELLLVLRKYRWEGGRLTGDEPILRTQAAKLVMVLAFSCVCFLIGYLVNAKWLLPYFVVDNNSNTTYLPATLAQRLTSIWDGWQIAAGVRYSRLGLVGVRGLSLMAALLWSSYLVWASATGLKQRGEEAFEKRVLRCMLASSLVTTTFIFVFEGGWRWFQLYYVPVIVLAFPVLALEMDRLRDCAATAARKLMILLTCACLLFQGAYSAYYLRFDKKDMDRWNGLDFNVLNVTDRIGGCAAFMQENGYTHGLIGYWYANAMMEITDGGLTMGPLELENTKGEPTLSVTPWGTSRSAFAPQNLPPQVVVFVETPDVAAFVQNHPDAVKAYENYFFTGFVISSDAIE